MDNKNNKIVIILAGGNGKKIWPVSNDKMPEQFVYLLDNTTLFKKTVEIVSDMFVQENIYLVINNKFKQTAMEQAEAIKESNIFTEPLSKQTAPALGLALMLLEDKYDDDTVVCVLPSDQLIRNVQEYNYAVNTACEAADKLNALIIVGIKPDRPSTNFGYIQFAHNKNDEKNNKIPANLLSSGIRKSINFVEKPDSETAQKFINSGDFSWNAGILVAKKKILKEAFQNSLNYHYEKFVTLGKTIGTEEYLDELESLYKTFNKISIEYGILENAPNIYMLKTSFNWDNINSWKDVHRVELKDALDNVMMGNIISLDTSDSLIISNNKLVAIVGLEDVVVVNTDEAVLVCKKSEADKLDALVNFIQNYNPHIR